MKRVVCVSLDEFNVEFHEDRIIFDNSNTTEGVQLPIEVFYQMWNSDEMINHMEAYFERRKSDNSLNLT